MGVAVSGVDTPVTLVVAQTSRNSRGPASTIPPAMTENRVTVGRVHVKEGATMRHRIGIALAAVMTAELFFLGGWGYLRVLGMPAPGEQLAHLPAGGGSLTADHRLLAGLAVLAGTGLLIGVLIAMPQVSPLAVGLPGVLLLGWTGLYLINVRQAVDLIPLRADDFGAGFEAMLLNGTLAAFGCAMIIPMFVPSRWRRRAAAGSTASLAEIRTVPVGQPVPAPSAARLEPVAATTRPASVEVATQLEPLPPEQPVTKTSWTVAERYDN
jgi:hypothetical protein